MVARVKEWACDLFRWLKLLWSGKAVRRHRAAILQAVQIYYKSMCEVHESLARSYFWENHRRRREELQTSMELLERELKCVFEGHERIREASGRDTLDRAIDQFNTSLDGCNDFKMPSLNRAKRPVNPEWIDCDSDESDGSSRPVLYNGGRIILLGLRADASSAPKKAAKPVGTWSDMVRNYNHDSLRLRNLFEKLSRRKEVVVQSQMADSLTPRAYPAADEDVDPQEAEERQLTTRQSEGPSVAVSRPQEERGAAQENSPPRPQARVGGEGLSEKIVNRRAARIEAAVHRSLHSAAGHITPLTEPA